MGVMPEPAAKSSTSRPFAASTGKPSPKGAVACTCAAGWAAAMTASDSGVPRLTSSSPAPSPRGALPSAKYPGLWSGACSLTTWPGRVCVGASVPKSSRIARSDGVSSQASATRSA